MSRPSFGSIFEEVVADLNISEEREVVLLKECKNAAESVDTLEDAFLQFRKVADDIAQTKQERIYILSHLGYLSFDIDSMRAYGT